MSVRYARLRKVTITIRDDGILDVVRERAENGESFRGLANLEEAFDAIRAHGGESLEGVRRERDVYRAALQAIADDSCRDEECVCCGLDAGNAQVALNMKGES